MVQKYYAVARGRKTGIFNTWKECEQLVKNYPKARYKSFIKMEEAKVWLKTISGAKGNETMQENTVSAAKIIVYTDGGSRNHGNVLGQHVKENDKAAWAYYIITPTMTFKKSAGEYGSTNNRMEIMALLRALETLLEKRLQLESIQVVMDSRYVLNSITKNWLKNWERNNWCKANGQEVLNKELWERIAQLLPKFKDLRFSWTKGHAVNAGNNEVDRLLNETMDKM
ncbi:ribonuclease H family protein [Ligilactobacillus sp. WILCCON 0076]|uniref:Ribonuclease H n=1 Tax=Ligilactobacillus ubinensis TaxID=2876789 RepID=A0A9X2JKK9_9LACO|nr:ribonuclease H family protein [Ligilactobacillus ubinensis]MCP0886302.1 ribonuclease H family protein [Ligilactobacillus ubinensis]